MSRGERPVEHTVDVNHGAHVREDALISGGIETNEGGRSPIQPRLGRGCKMVLVRGPAGSQAASVNHVPLEILEVALQEEWETLIEIHLR